MIIYIEYIIFLLAIIFIVPTLTPRQAMLAALFGGTIAIIHVVDAYIQVLKARKRVKILQDRRIKNCDLKK